MSTQMILDEVITYASGDEVAVTGVRTGKLSGRRIYSKPMRYEKVRRIERNFIPGDGDRPTQARITYYRKDIRGFTVELVVQDSMVLHERSFVE